tara:strand:- start:646 stop:1200 length:555 start_codon:yes stop_codon:yes gene_type:complete
MVKNNTGGSKHKKMGRKFVNASSASRPLRLSTCEDEIYAVVSKTLGHGMCNVKDHTEKEYLCIIRNKFKGRGKRDNMINLGTWVLVGARSFESVQEGKKQKCDLLEVYSDAEKNKLKQTGNKIFDKLKSNDGFGDTTNDEDDFVFSNEAPSEDLFEEEINSKVQKKEEKMDFICEEGEIDIDDI